MGLLGEGPKVIFKLNFTRNTLSFSLQKNIDVHKIAFFILF